MINWQKPAHQQGLRAQEGLGRPAETGIQSGSFRLASLAQDQMIFQDESVETGALERLDRVLRPADDRLLNVE